RLLGPRLPPDASDDGQEYPSRSIGILAAGQRGKTPGTPAETRPPALLARRVRPVARRRRGAGRAARWRSSISTNAVAGRGCPASAGVGERARIAKRD